MNFFSKIHLLISHNKIEELMENKVAKKERRYSGKRNITK